MRKACRCRHVKRKQNARQPMRIEQRRRDGAGHKQAPVPKSGDAVFFTHDAFNRQPDRERETKQETSVDIDPKRHHRQEPI